MYPTDTKVVIADASVSFVRGKDRIVIYAEKTVWQEDAVEVGRYNSETDKFEEIEPTPCKEQSGPALQVEKCTCGPGWTVRPGCWFLSNQSLWIHLHDDHIAAFQDYEQDMALLFDMIEPAIMANAKSKIGELLKQEPPQHTLSKDQLEARLKEFEDKKAEHWIWFTFA